MYNYLKKIILKPMFLFLYKIFPNTAVNIRNFIINQSIVIGKKKSDGLPRLLADVTIVSHRDVKTGIQRVVNSISKEIFCNMDTHFEFVQFMGKSLATSNKYRCIFDQSALERETYIGINQGDTLLLLDSSWDRADIAAKMSHKIHEKQGKVYGVIYDLFPIQYPELFDSQYFIDSFTEWHDMLLQCCDGVLCISKITADVVIQYYAKKKFSRDKSLKVYYFPMGATLPTKTEKQNIRHELVEFVNSDNVFFMVGTVEPRKGHATVLETFKELLKERPDVRLLLIGKDGWKNDDFHASLKESLLFKKHILWINDATDEELQWCYKNTKALIAASKDEGFGLPLIEAAYFGLPIICSDIPIFREVAGNGATYFKVMDAQALKETILLWLEEEIHPASTTIKLYTWEESAKAILSILNGEVGPYKILN